MDQSEKDKTGSIRASSMTICVAFVPDQVGLSGLKLKLTET